MLGPEILMGFQAVPRYAENHRIKLLKLLHPVPEVLSLSSTARGVVFRIEINHHVLTFQIVQANSLVSGSGCFKIRYGFV